MLTKDDLMVWDCKVVVKKDGKELPGGSDVPPREAVIEAIESLGFEVIACSSGWGGTLSTLQLRAVNEGFESVVDPAKAVYIAGMQDT